VCTGRSTIFFSLQKLRTGDYLNVRVEFDQFCAEAIGSKDELAFSGTCSFNIVFDDGESFVDDTELWFFGSGQAQRLPEVLKRQGTELNVPIAGDG